MQEKYPHIKYYIVLAYMPEGRYRLSKTEEEHTLYLEGLETVPKKLAIPWRNKWMVHRSSIVVCYIAHAASRAAKFVDYARQQGKEVISLMGENKK